MTRPEDLAPPAGIDGIAASLALNHPPGSKELGDTYAGMIDGFRQFVDAVAGAALTGPIAQDLERDLRSWTKALDELQVADADRLWGRWLDWPGRSQGLVPTAAYEMFTPTAAEGTVVFGQFYVGKNGVTHGGAIPLLFDELFGRMGFASNTAGRTAFLRTNYRAVTPIDVELTVIGRLDRLEGRKHFFSGELRHGDLVCVEAESLWVELRAGQP